MLFPIFVVMTLLEIYVLVTVGQAIGGLSTVLLVIVTALIGSTLLRQQGWSTMAKAQQSIAEGKTPALEMLEGVVILVSGVLLLTPGFITDGLGLLGLMPWTRRYFINHILEKNAKRVFSQKNSVFIHKTKNQEKTSDNKNETIVSKGTFTTCKKRPDDKCPPWIIESKKVRHDKIKKKCRYILLVFFSKHLVQGQGVLCHADRMLQLP